MDDKITIIEGPTPVFESTNDAWAVGLNEGPLLYNTALTHLRTFNSHALVERCYQAWSHNQPIFLHYRNEIGLEEKIPIVAARALETEEGHVLLLWVRQELDIANMEEELNNLLDNADIDDEDEDDEDDDGDITDFTGV